MKSTKRRKRSLMLLLLALSISIHAYAEKEITSPVIVSDGENYTFDDDTKITVSNSEKDPAIRVNSGGNLSSAEGKVLNIDTRGGKGNGIEMDSTTGNSSFNLGETHIKTDMHGIYTIGDSKHVNTIRMKLGDHSSIESGMTALKVDRNSIIEVGTDSQIHGAAYGPTVASVSASNGGKIIIGDRAEIANILNTGTNQNGIAVMAQNTVGAPSEEATVTIGNQSRIYTLGTKAGNHAVKAGNTNYYKAVGKIDIGNFSDISTIGDESYALYNVYQGSEIKVGTDAYIHTSGKNASAIRVGTENAQDGNNAGGLTEIGERAVVETSGTGSHGVDARRDGSLVKIGKDSQILTTGKDAYGVYAYEGGQIELSGAQISSEKSYAIYANERDDTTQKGSVVQGDGQFIIDGDLYAGNYSTIDLSLQDGSKITATASKSSSGILNLAMTNGTEWKMDGDSELTQLKFNGGDVHFATDISGGSYGTLAVDNLSGSQGTFYMRTDIVGDGAGINGGDKLLVTGTSSGNHSIYVTNSGSANTDGSETLTLVETADGATSGVDFGLRNVVELGGYQYKLRQDPNQMGNWELYGTRSTDPNPSNPADAGVNLFSGAYLLNYAEMNTLMQRMGDLRQEGHEKGNIWARNFGGEMKTKGDHFLRGYEIDYWGLQVGADKKIPIKKGSLYVGGMFGYTKGNIDYSYGSGSIDSKYLGIYGTYMAPNGFYSDLVLKYGWMKDDFNVYDSAGALVKGSDIGTNGFTASLEVGKQYYFNQDNKEGWYVEPQGQISFSRQDGDSFTASNGLRIRVDSYHSILGRLGTNVGYQVKGGKNPINAYAKVSFVHEFDGDVDYQLNRSKESTSYGDSWWTYGVGIAAKVGERHHVYLDLERASGGNFTQSWAINGGYRFAW